MSSAPKKSVTADARKPTTAACRKWPRRSARGLRGRRSGAGGQRPDGRGPNSIWPVKSGDRAVDSENAVAFELGRELAGRSGPRAPSARGSGSGGRRPNGTTSWPKAIDGTDGASVACGVGRVVSPRLPGAERDAERSNPRRVAAGSTAADVGRPLGQCAPIQRRVRGLLEPR